MSQPTREQLASELETLIKQMPERKLTYTFLPSPFTITIFHDGMWDATWHYVRYGKEYGTRTTAFQDIFNFEFGGVDIDDKALQELVDAAKALLGGKP